MTGLLHNKVKAFALVVAVSLVAIEVQAQDFTVNGTVVNTAGESLPGVNVIVQGTTTGTATDSEGYFELVVPSPADTLVLSYIGYISRSLPIQGQAELGTIELQQESFEGEEIVVVGYGEQEKVTVTGAVQSVQAPEEALRTPTGQLSNSFAGQLAGVTAFQRSGEPGANAAEFYIRGISTFSGATSPLIIIDGVEASQGDLNALAPEVIESFSILKDATATAVYGSRGANGVMVVNTKTGRDLDTPQISIRVENAVSAPTTVPNFVEGARYMELYNEAVQGRGTGEILYSQDQIDGTRAGRNPYVYPNVDWYGQLFKDYSLQQTANVNILGGGERLNYFMSATLNRNNGMLRSFDLNSYNNNITVNRYSFQNNLDMDVSSTTNLSLKLNTQLRDYHGPAQSANNIFSLVMEANPADFPVMFPSDSTREITFFGGKGGGRFNSGYRNPFAEMVSGYQDNFQSTVLATLSASQELDYFVEGLTFEALASFKNWSWTNTSRSRGYNQFEVESYEPSGGNYAYTTRRVGTEQDVTLSTDNASGGDRSLYFEGRLSYNRRFADAHNVSAMLLYNRSEYNVNAPTDLIASLPRRTMGYAGRLRYAYANTYLAELNFGYNGSENFADGHKFGFFPSASVGYVVSNENFWAPLSSVVSLFKVRGSWGLVGNDEIGGQRFVYLSDINLYGQGFTTGRDQNYSRSGPTYNRFANPNITWEVGEKINLGLDLGLFDQLTITANVFQENRRDIFLQRSTIPTSTGTAGTSVFGNLGQVTNRGFDLSVDYSSNLTDELFMALKGTFTYASNEVKDIDEPPFQLYPNLSLEGHSINSLLGLEARRLFIDQAEIDYHAEQQLGGFVMPGDIMYADVNGDGLVNSDDRVRMGHPTVPEITYGFGPSLYYKNFDFSFLLQGVARTSFFIGGFHPFGTSTIRNVLTFIEEDHWSPENPDIYASYPRLSKLWNDNNTANSSYWLRNGSFLKLRNIELGYRWRDARFYLSGRNVLTFSPFSHWDPEQGGGNGLSYPTQRIFNAGVQLSF